MSEVAPARRTVVRVGTAEADDGALLSYRVDGEAPGAALICSNGIGVSTFFWQHLAEHFAPRRAVITWDYRGHGRTPVPEHPEEVTVVRCARDLWAVADAVGAREVVLLGHSMGCQVSLEALRQRPGRVRALVPMLGASGRIFESFGPGGEALVPVWRALIELGAAMPHLAERALRGTLGLPGVWALVRALGVVHPDLCPREEFVPYFEHLRQLDLRVYFALARDLLSHDAQGFLAEVKVPTLVIAGERDLFTPMRRSEELAAGIAGAELLVVRGGSHAALVEQPELVSLAVEKLLRRHGIA